MFPTAAELPQLVRSAYPESSLPRRIAGLLPADAGWSELVDLGAPGTKRPSAVVILFVPPAPGSSDARIVLTRRSIKVRSHRGQIGFAGGRAEADDATPVVTALRELDEELAVKPDLVAPLGILPATVALDGSPVVPVLALTSVDLSGMIPSPDEVETVFAEPWTSFVAARDRIFRFNIFGNWRTSHLFDLPGPPARPVWGLTALILAAAGFE